VEPSRAGHRGPGWERGRELLPKDSGLLRMSIHDGQLLTQPFTGEWYSLVCTGI